jgi:hypothetical protein
MAVEYLRRQTLPLRLSPFMRIQANDLAHRERISLNHFVSLAVAKKISRMEQNLCMKEQAKPKQEEPQFRRLAFTRQP